MAKGRDLMGGCFGRLTVLERAEGLRQWYALWRCRCDCGRETEVSAGDFLFGSTVSCGCVRCGTGTP